MLLLLEFAIFMYTFTLLHYGAVSNRKSLSAFELQNYFLTRNETAIVLSSYFRWILFKLYSGMFYLLVTWYVICLKNPHPYCSTSTISFHIIINVRQLLTNVAHGICVFRHLLAPFPLILTRDLFYWACSMGTHALFAPYCVRSKSSTILIAANLSRGGYSFPCFPDLFQKLSP